MITFTQRQLRMPLFRVSNIAIQAGVRGLGRVDIVPLFGDYKQIHDLNHSLWRVNWFVGVLLSERVFDQRIQNNDQFQDGRVEDMAPSRPRPLS